MKRKLLIGTILVLIAMLMAVGITSGFQRILISPIQHEAIAILEPEITIETNELQYDIGEIVEITYTNVGNAVAGFVIGISRPVMPWIIDASSEDVLFLTDPSHSHTCVMMYDVLEPGESLIIEWDQQYFGYYDDTFTPSEQVPEGQYYIELGYWKVTGAYNPPYMVPGGPPEYFTTSEIFSIEDI